MSRNTHHRQRDHFGLDLDTSVEIEGAVGEFTDATGLHTVLSSLAGSIGIQFILDGGGSTITTGIKGDVEMPFAGVIKANRLFADQTGSIVIDLWKDTYANFPPTDIDSITASAPPTISSSNKSQDTTLTGWTTTFLAGDIIRVNVDSATSIQRVTLSLLIRRT